MHITLSYICTIQRVAPTVAVLCPQNSFGLILLLATNFRSESESQLFRSCIFLLFRLLRNFCLYLIILRPCHACPTLFVGTDVRHGYKTSNFGALRKHLNKEHDVFHDKTVIESSSACYLKRWIQTTRGTWWVVNLWPKPTEHLARRQLEYPRQRPKFCGNTFGGKHRSRCV